MAEIVKSSEAMVRALALIEAGEVVAIPTETVYGLAADATNGLAVARIFEAKGRPRFNPLIAHVSTLAMAESVAVFDPLSRVLAKAFWPGPLTLVLPRRPDLGYELGEPADTVGVRCPDHALVQTIATAVGPIATTSANRHREPSAPTAEGVAATFGAGLALVLDGGRCEAPPSTVVAVAGAQWKVLREGPIPLAEVRAAAGG